MYGQSFVSNRKTAVIFLEKRLLLGNIRLLYLKRFEISRRGFVNANFKVLYVVQNYQNLAKSVQCKKMMIQALKIQEKLHLVLKTLCKLCLSLRCFRLTFSLKI